MRKKETPSSEYIANFLAFVRDVKAETVTAENHVSELDGATTDWKHQIELGSYADRAKAATQLSHVLKERRKYKNVVDINKQLVEYLNSPEFTVCYRKLEQLLGQVRKQERYVESRNYTPRTVTALPIMTNKYIEEEN